jgi:hypothetical protein
MQSELSPEKQREFAAIQTELAAQISLTDCRDFSDLRTAAGVDLAYWNTPDGREHAVCCIVVIDTQTHTVIEKAQADGGLSPFSAVLSPGMYIAETDRPLFYSPGCSPVSFRARHLVVGTFTLQESAHEN